MPTTAQKTGYSQTAYKMGYVRYSRILLASVTGKSCTKYVRGRREKHRRCRFSIHQHAACTHAQHQPQEGNEQLRLRDGVQPRPTQNFHVSALDHTCDVRQVSTFSKRRKAAKSIVRKPKVRMLCHCSANRGGEAVPEKCDAGEENTDAHAAQTEATSLFSPRVRRAPHPSNENSGLGRTAVSKKESGLRI